MSPEGSEFSRLVKEILKNEVLRNIDPILLNCPPFTNNRKMPLWRRSFSPTAFRNSKIYPSVKERWLTGGVDNRSSTLTKCFLGRTDHYVYSALHRRHVFTAIRNILQIMIRFNIEVYSRVLGNRYNAVLERVSWYFLHCVRYARPYVFR